MTRPPHDSDAPSSHSSNAHFRDVARARLSRRAVLRGGAAAAAALFVGAACSDEETAGSPLDAGTDTGGPNLPRPDGSSPLDDAEVAKDAAVAEKPLLGFSAVPKGRADALVVPAGYTATVLFRLGDPLDSTTAAYANDGTATDFDRRAGDHHDGMELCPLDATGQRRDPRGSERGLLVINHENVTTWALHANGGTAGAVRPREEVDREVAAHGLSVVAVRKVAGRFEIDRASSFNRRITAATPFEVRGPLRGNALATTPYSPAGTETRGTINNCGTGTTPWGTVLSGEENWASYVFRATGDDLVRSTVDPKSVVALRRYGATEGDGPFSKRWDSGGTGDMYARWNATVSAGATPDYRNVLNTFGYLVEVDPYAPRAALVKRSALGRMAHEGAAFRDPKAGKPIVVYMGDDSRDEYIYKFVSKAKWSDADREPSDRIATGNKYLDEGTLYAAKFLPDGTGTWEELSLANPLVAGFAAYAFADLADVVVNPRLAADAAGATKMDRPEWCSVNPKNNEVYFTLTNNSRRTTANTDGPNPRAYDDVRGAGDAQVTQRGNVHGHILRLAEMGDDPEARTFRWDVYLFGAEATSEAARVNLSGLTAENDFSSPDGLWFSPYSGVCWIQTDDGAYTDVTNCMMLAGLPGKVGDGTAAAIPYATDGGDGGARTVMARPGARATPATLKRFLVGPVQCEITGIAETPDGKALFVNIQHPGEEPPAGGVSDPTRFASHWPDGGAARPRSATVVITKDDGGRVGT